MTLDRSPWLRCQIVGSGTGVAPAIDRQRLAQALGGPVLEEFDALGNIHALRELRVSVVPCVVLHAADGSCLQRPLPPGSPEESTWAALTGAEPPERLAADLAHPASLAEQAAANDVSTLTHCLSHELRGPIRNSARLIDLLLDSAVLEPEARATLERVRGSSQRLAEQVDGLVQFLQIGQAPIRPTRLDISMLSTALLDELTTIWPHPERVVRIDPDLQIWADSPLLTLALRHLLENACKFSQRETRPEVHVGLHARAGFDVLRISDNGAGFSAAHAQSLFQPFARIHLQSEFPGNGIGLALIRRVAERHGGWAWADVASPGSTRFMLALPTHPHGAEHRGPA
ncbi:MAG: hypothetical protein RLZZ598_465 [Pseudomonadota bacterium]|jgi:signal transduction histidine kinase